MAADREADWLRRLLVVDGNAEAALQLLETPVLGTLDLEADAGAVLSGLCMAVSAERTRESGGTVLRWATALWGLLKSATKPEGWRNSVGKALEFHLAMNSEAAAAVLLEVRRRLAESSADVREEAVAGLLLSAAACARGGVRDESLKLFSCIEEESRCVSILESCCLGTPAAAEWATAAVVSVFQDNLMSGQLHSAAASHCLPALLGTIISSACEAASRMVLRLTLAASQGRRLCACSVAGYDPRRRSCSTECAACTRISPPTTPWKKQHRTASGGQGARPPSEPGTAESGAAWLLLLARALRWSADNGQSTSFLRLLDEQLLRFLEIPTLRPGVAFVACLKSVAETGLPGAVDLLSRAVSWAAELLGPSDGGTPRQRFVAGLLLVVDLPPGCPPPCTTSIRWFLAHEPDAAVLRTWVEAGTSAGVGYRENRGSQLHPRSPARQAEAVLATGVTLSGDQGGGEELLGIDGQCDELLRLCHRPIHKGKGQTTTGQIAHGSDTAAVVEAMSPEKVTALMGALDAVLEWLACQPAFSETLARRFSRITGDDAVTRRVLIRSLLDVRIKLSERQKMPVSVVPPRVDAPTLPVRAAVALLESLLSEQEQQATASAGRRSSSRRRSAPVDTGCGSGYNSNNREAIHLCTLLCAAFADATRQQTGEVDDDALLRAIAAGVPLPLVLPEIECLSREGQAPRTWGRALASLCVMAERMLSEPADGRALSSDTAAAVLGAVAAAMETVTACVAQRASTHRGLEAVARVPSRIVGAGWVASDEWNDGRQRSKGSSTTAMEGATPAAAQLGESEQGRRLPSPPSPSSLVRLAEFGSALSAARDAATRHHQLICTATLRAVVPSAGRMHWTALKSCLAVLPLGCLLLTFVEGFARRLDSPFVSEEERTAWARLLAALGELSKAEESHHLAPSPRLPAIAKAASLGTLPSALASRWLESLWMLRPQPAAATDIGPLTATVLSSLRPQSLAPPLLAAAVVTLSNSGNVATSTMQAHAMLSAPHHPRWMPLVSAMRKSAWWVNAELKLTRLWARIGDMLPILVSQLERLLWQCDGTVVEACWADAALRGCVLPLSQAVGAALEGCDASDAAGDDAARRSGLARAVAVVATFGARAARVLTAEARGKEDPERRKGSASSQGAAHEGRDWFVVDVAAALWAAWLLVRKAMQARYPALHSRRVLATALDEADAEALQLTVWLSSHRAKASRTEVDTRRVTRSGSRDLRTSSLVMPCSAIVSRVRRVVQGVGLPMEPYVGLGEGLGLHRPVGLNRPPECAAIEPSAALGRLVEKPVKRVSAIERPDEAAPSPAGRAVEGDARRATQEKRKAGATTSVNPFIRAVMGRLGDEAMSSSEGSGDEEDTFSDLEDFIVCNPDKDYDRLLEQRTKKKRKTSYFGDV